MSTSRTGSLRARPTTRQTHRSGRQRAGPLRYVGPPRPGPLPKCPSMGKMTTDSTYEWRKIGEQVNSRLHGEGISNAITECMALGKPIVATDYGGTPELVLEGQTGFLVPSHDAGALTGRVLKLLNNPELANKFGMEGR